MKSLRMALLYGFLAWLVPFVVSFVIFPLRDIERPLFESIMPVVVSICAVLFASLYLNSVESAVIKEGVLLGLVFLAVSVAIDLIATSSGPMQMSPQDYMKDIGITYLIFPVSTIGLAWQRSTRRTAAEVHVPPR